MRAFRYLVEVLDERSYYDLPEIFLPDQGIVCNVSSEFASTKVDPLRTVSVARAFACSGPRNQDREGHQRPTERYDLPPEVIADLVALAELTARQRELAARVGERVANVVPLDSTREHALLLDAMHEARARIATSPEIEDIQQRMDRIREGSITDDQAKRFRDLRTELAKVGAR